MNQSLSQMSINTLHLVGSQGQRNVNFVYKVYFVFRHAINIGVCRKKKIIEFKCTKPALDSSFRLVTPFKRGYSRVILRLQLLFFF